VGERNSTSGAVIDSRNEKRRWWSVGRNVGGGCGFDSKMDMVIS
jgi:hypothetical protein